VHDVAGDGGDELAVGLGEDLLLLPGDEEVGEGCADDVGDLGGVEAGGGRCRVVDRVVLGVNVNRKRASPGRGGGDARKPTAALRVRRR